LAQLTELSLYANQLTKLPAEIGALRNLISLHLSSNQLTSLPPEFENLGRLRNLSLNKNLLTNMPAEIGRLTNLNELNLGSNQLTSIPAAIGNLKQLNYLGLSNNQLTHLPAQIRDLSNLSKLDLTANQLTNLQPEIGTLHNLKRLYLEGNPNLDVASVCTSFSDFPETIVFTTSSARWYTNRKHLVIALSKIDSLPVEITRMKNITGLDFPDNKLTTLPPELWDMEQLTHLILPSNLFTSLPTGITKLKNLKELNLYDNPIPADELERLREQLPNCLVVGEGYKELLEKYSREKKYGQAYTYQLKVLEKDSANYNNWYSLSFYALFADQPQEAVRAAKKTLELRPDAQSVESNLALGYLLNNQWSEAEKIYLKRKGQQFTDGKRLWDEVFLTDIAALEAAGITHPDFEKVKQLFQK
jgi:tetratricopeptide (TPR) repeat protein